jgi:hypothetical protein
MGLAPFWMQAGGAVDHGFIPTTGLLLPGGPI